MCHFHTLLWAYSSRLVDQTVSLFTYLRIWNRKRHELDESRLNMRTNGYEECCYFHPSVLFPHLPYLLIYHVNLKKYHLIFPPTITPKIPFHYWRTKWTHPSRASPCNPIPRSPPSSTTNVNIRTKTEIENDFHNHSTVRDMKDEH